VPGFDARLAVLQAMPPLELRWFDRLRIGRGIVCIQCARNPFLLRDGLAGVNPEILTDAVNSLSLGFYALNSQKHFSLIKKSHQQKGQKQSQERNDQIPKALGDM